MQRFLCAFLFSLPLQAHAGLIFTIERTGASVDFPMMSVLITDAALPAAISLTLGDTTLNVDSAQIVSQSAGLTIELVSPDEVNGEERSDVLSWLFTDAAIGSGFSARVDIDRDTGSATVDWQTALFNNGDLPNAELTVLWNDGTSSSIMLPDEPGRDPLAPYVVTVASVPEASSLVLGLIGCCTILACRMRRAT